MHTIVESHAQKIEVSVRKGGRVILAVVSMLYLLGNGQLI
jgi:hypothetical protein